MSILIIIAVLIIGGLLNFVIKPKAAIIYSIAKGYVFLALLIAICYWLFYFAGIKNHLITKMLAWLLRWGGLSAYLILGYLILNILLALHSKVMGTAYHPIQKTIRSTLWGISILTGNLFIIATVGKATNFKEMSSFFATSGYAIWFLYFIMTAETLGAVGILLHFKLKTGIPATAGLLLIMLGAVYTHWHNKDPFSDSYAAVIQLIVLSLMLLIYYSEWKASQKVISNANAEIIKPAIN